MNNNRLVVNISTADKNRIISKAERAGMNPSQYVRSVLLDEQIPDSNGIKQKTMSYVCHLLKELQLLDGGKNGKLIEEISELCRLLK